MFYVWKETRIIFFLSFLRGLIREGDIMMLGPSERGDFTKTRVVSIRRNRVPCHYIKAGQSATLALSYVEKMSIRRVSWASFFVKKMICNDREFRMSLYELTFYLK